MTAPGPHKSPTTRRAAREQRDDTAARPEHLESRDLPRSTTDAAAAPVRRSNYVAAPPDAPTPRDEMFDVLDLGSLVPAEASLPRLHRSTFATERTRPGSRSTPSAAGPEAFTPFERRAVPPPAKSEVVPTSPSAAVQRVERASPVTGPTRRAMRRAGSLEASVRDAGPGAAVARRADSREAGLLEAPTHPARHARARRAAGVRTVFGLAAAAALILGGATAVTAALTGSAVSDAASLRAAQEMSFAAADAFADSGDSLPARAAPLPAPAESIPVPTLSAAPASVDLCADPAFAAALTAGDDAGAIALAGGGHPFRAAVAAGQLPCVPLDHPTHVWFVVNKVRPYDPIDYSPSGLAKPDGVRDLANTVLRADASAALSAMVRAAAEAGAGEIALQSGFRSYATQQTTYGSQVDARGTESAELVSARPGHSEHQSGLAVDVVACAGGCGGLDGLAGTPQGDWILEHAWEHGWVVRYEDGRTGVTGYAPEPWHLRYIGTELAAAYHSGGWHTLEEFFGLAAAPDYLD